MRVFGQLSISTKELYQGFKNIIPHRLAHGPNQTSTHKKYHYPPVGGINLS